MSRSARIPPRELGSDPQFAARVRRLVVVSAVALGVIWWLAATTLDLPGWVTLALAAGWVLMPILLLASLARPWLRYALPVPATLIGGGLLAILAFWLPAEPLSAVGWTLVTDGILVGGALGLWLWYRLLPVPAALDDPFSPARWGLIGLHVALVVIGLTLVVAGSADLVAIR